MHNLNAFWDVIIVWQITFMYSGAVTFLKLFWDGVPTTAKEVLSHNIEFICLTCYLGKIGP